MPKSSLNQWKELYKESCKKNKWLLMLLVSIFSGRALLESSHGKPLGNAASLFQDIQPLQLVAITIKDKNCSAASGHKMI